MGFDNQCFASTVASVSVITAAATIAILEFDFEFMVLLGLNLVSTLLPPNAVHAGPFYMKKAEMLCLLVHFKLQLTNLRCGVKYLADAARDALNCLFSGH